MTDPQAVGPASVRRYRTLLRCGFGMIVGCLLAGSAIIAHAVGYAEAIEALERQQYEPARRAFRALAKAGDPRAMFYLGVMHERGLGVAVDLRTAFAWYERAALADHPEAQYNLGNAFKHGRGSVQSEELASYWWRKAAAVGQPNAQYNLGLQFYHGKGVAKDREKAVALLQQAATDGHPRAQELVKSGQIPAGDHGPARGESSPESSDRQDADRGEAPAGRPAKRGTSPPSPSQWLAGQNPDHYTIQLAVLSTRANAETFLNSHRLAGRARAVALEREDRIYFHVLLGSYPTRDAATGALAALTPELKQLKAWPRPFGGLQGD